MVVKRREWKEKRKKGNKNDSKENHSWLKIHTRSGFYRASTNILNIEGREGRHLPWQIHLYLPLFLSPSPSPFCSPCRPFFVLYELSLLLPVSLSLSYFLSLSLSLFPSLSPLFLSLSLSTLLPLFLHINKINKRKWFIISFILSYDPILLCTTYQDFAQSP